MDYKGTLSWHSPHFRGIKLTPVIEPQQHELHNTVDPLISKHTGTDPCSDMPKIRIL